MLTCQNFAQLSKLSSTIEPKNFRSISSRLTLSQTRLQNASLNNTVIEKDAHIYKNQNREISKF